MGTAAPKSHLRHESVIFGNMEKGGQSVPENRGFLIQVFLNIDRYCEIGRMRARYPVKRDADREPILVILPIRPGEPGRFFPPEVWQPGVPQRSMFLVPKPPVGWIFVVWSSLE